MTLAMPASTDSLRGDVEFDGAQINARARRHRLAPSATRGALRPVGLAHAGIDGVAGVREGAGGERGRSRSTRR